MFPTIRIAIIGSSDTLTEVIGLFRNRYYIALQYYPYNIAETDFYRKEYDIVLVDDYTKCSELFTDATITLNIDEMNIKAYELNDAKLIGFERINDDIIAYCRDVQDFIFNCLKYETQQQR